MTILFEDTVHREAAMPFWKLQFNINYKAAIFVCAYGCLLGVLLLYLLMHTSNLIGSQNF